MDKKFIDDFYDTFGIDENTLFKCNMIIKDSNLITWLKYLNKKDFLYSLKKNFELGVDYVFIINSVDNMQKSEDEIINMINSKSYLDNVKDLDKNDNYSHRTYFLTLDCAKFLALSVNHGKRAKLIKKYFIYTEKAMFIFKDTVLKRILRKYFNLARSVSPSFNLLGNMLYLIRKIDGGKVYFKIGITLDLLRRASVYNNGTLDFAEYIFVIYTKFPYELESCTKSIMRKYRLIKNRELIDHDIGIIINTILAEELLINRIDDIGLVNKYSILNEGNVVNTLEYDFNADVKKNSKMITNLMDNYKPLVIKSPYYTENITWLEPKSTQQEI